MNAKRTVRARRAKQEYKPKIQEPAESDRSQFSPQYEYDDWLVPGHTKQVIAAGLANALVLG